MTFIPIGDRVMLRRLDAAALASSASPFTIPDAAKEKATECEVVAIPSQPYVTEYGTVLACPCNPGDRVLIGKYSGSEHKLRGAGPEGQVTSQEVLFVRWSELLAVESASAQKERLDLAVDEQGFPKMPKVPDEIWQAHGHLTNAQQAMCGAQTDPSPARHRSRPSPLARPDIDTDPDADQYAQDFARQLARRDPRETIL